jgi:hypothetical protein
MLANTSFGVRPTAIYANPVLLDLIDREMKAEFNVVLNTKPIEGGLTVKTLSTQAGDIPLIPEWTLPYTGTPGSGSAVLPAYIVTEDLIEYHWLGEPNPRVFQLGLPGIAGQPVCGGQVRRRRRQGRQLRALPGAGRPLRTGVRVQGPGFSGAISGPWALEPSTLAHMTNTKGRTQWDICCPRSTRSLD